MKVLVTFMGVVLGTACVGPFSELLERQYANADAARAADPSGWIPPVLPSDATSIREVHKVDASRTWGCFRTRRTDEVRALLSHLRAHKAPGPIGGRPAEIFRDFSWWPGETAAQMPVWIVDTPANRWSAEKYWQEHTGQSHVDGVTVFTAEPTESREEWCVGQLPAIDLHHGEYSADPPYRAIHVYGVESTERIAAAFADYGMAIITRTADGFLASRPNG